MLLRSRSACVPEGNRPLRHERLSVCARRGAANARSSGRPTSMQSTRVCAAIAALNHIEMPQTISITTHAAASGRKGEILLGAAASAQCMFVARS